MKAWIKAASDMLSHALTHSDARLDVRWRDQVGELLTNTPGARTFMVLEPGAAYRVTRVHDELVITKLP